MYFLQYHGLSIQYIYLQSSSSFINSCYLTSAPVASSLDPICWILSLTLEALVLMLSWTAATKVPNNPPPFSCDLLVNSHHHLRSPRFYMSNPADLAMDYKHEWGCFTAPPSNPKLYTIPSFLKQSVHQTMWQDLSSALSVPGCSLLQKSQARNGFQTIKTSPII